MVAAECVTTVSDSEVVSSGVKSAQLWCVRQEPGNLWRSAKTREIRVPQRSCTSSLQRQYNCSTQRSQLLIIDLHPQHAHCHDTQTLRRNAWARFRHALEAVVPCPSQLRIRPEAHSVLDVRVACSLILAVVCVCVCVCVCDKICMRWPQSLTGTPRHTPTENDWDSRGTGPCCDQPRARLLSAKLGRKSQTSPVQPHSATIASRRKTLATLLEIRARKSRQEVVPPGDKTMRCVE